METTWIVVECFERDMALIGTFDNYEDAFDCMNDAFFEVFKENFSHEDYDDEHDEYFCGVNDAWLNGRDGNHDWKIFAIKG